MTTAGKGCLTESDHLRTLIKYLKDEPAVFFNPPLGDSAADIQLVKTAKFLSKPTTFSAERSVLTLRRLTRRNIRSNTLLAKVR